MQNRYMPKYIRKYLIFTIAVLPLCTYAKLVDWQDPTPSALAPFNNSAKQVANVANDDIFIYSHVPQAIKYTDKAGSRSY